MNKYRNETPENRTIIQGFWSDLMDLWRAAFKDEGSTDVSLKVTTVNDQMLDSAAIDAIYSLDQTNKELLKEIKLLNARFEEAYETSIDRGDL